MTRAALGLLLTLALSVSLAGAEGGEICRFRALDPENPFRRWLASQELTCVAAGAPLSFPPGWWNVFARARGAVSAAPLLIEGNAAPATVAPPLQPAASIVAQLPEGRGAVVYVPRRGSAFPLQEGRGVVPADEPLWLFVLDGATPVAVLAIAAVAPGADARVDARGAGPAAVIGWLQVPEADRAELASATGVLTPAVRAGTRDADALPPPTLLHGAFFRVRDVAPGTAELRLDGRGWVPARRVVKVQPGVTVAAVPLVARATGTLTVHWNTDQDLVALDRFVGACAEPEPPQVTIAVSRCSSSRPGARPDADCTPLREEKTHEFFGSITFDDIVPGTYRAEMRYGKLPPASSMAIVAPLRVADLRIFASYLRVHGSLTRGGEPLGEEASIRFTNGVGFAPAESDEYRGVVTPSGIQPESEIAVAACDGSPRALVIGDRPTRPFTRFNIDIPVNHLRVHVSDTFTRESLRGVLVKLEAMSLVRPVVVYTTTATTDDQGDVAWTGVPVRDLRLTVTHAGYEKRAVPTFAMKRSGEEVVDVQLVPLRGSRGRIESDQPFQNGSVVWFSPDGVETERADLASDGTFVFANRHFPEETLSVISASHPLWVMRAPPAEGRETLVLRFPNAPPLSLDVWLATPLPAGEARHITVAVGGVRVPQPVLARHQDLRRRPPHVRGSGPYPIGDLLATGPIDVLLGPKPEDVPSRARTLDIFALPQHANVPRVRLGTGERDVVFELREGQP